MDRNAKTDPPQRLWRIASPPQQQKLQQGDRHASVPPRRGCTSAPDHSPPGAVGNPSPGTSACCVARLSSIRKF